MPVSSWQGSPFCLLVSPSTAPVVDPLGQASHGDTGRRLPAVFLNISPLLPCVHLPSPALKVRAACGRIPQRPVPHHHSYLLPQPRLGCKGVREGVAEVWGDAKCVDCEVWGSRRVKGLELLKLPLRLTFAPPCSTRGRPMAGNSLCSTAPYRHVTYRPRSRRGSAAVHTLPLPLLLLRPLWTPLLPLLLSSPLTIRRPPSAAGCYHLPADGWLSSSRSWSTRCCPASVKGVEGQGLVWGHLPPSARKACASVKGVEVWIHLPSGAHKASAHMTYWQAWAGHSHYCRQGSHLPHLEYHAPLPALSDTPSPPGSTRRASQQYDRQYNRQSLSLWVRAPRTAPPSSRCHRHCPPPRPFLLLLLQGTSMMSRPILRLAVARPRLLPFKLPLRGISPWLPPRLLAALRHRPARSSCRLPLTVTRRPDGQCGTYSKRFGLVWEYIPQSVHGGFLGYMPPSHASYPHLYYTPLNVCMTTGKTTGAYPRRHRMAGVDKDLAVAIYV